MIKNRAIKSSSCHRSHPLTSTNFSISLWNMLVIFAIPTLFITAENKSLSFKSALRSILKLQTHNVMMSSRIWKFQNIWLILVYICADWTYFHPNCANRCRHRLANKALDSFKYLSCISIKHEVCICVWGLEEIHRYS